MPSEPLAPTILNRVLTSNLPPPGTWYVVAAPFPMDPSRPEILGQVVRLDGERYVVCGVDAGQPGRAIQEGDILGLRVRPEGARLF